MTSRDRFGVQRARRTLTCLVAASALLAGCSDSGDRASGETEPSASSTGSGPTGTATSTPDVEPATGKLVETSYFTVRVPDGFKVDVTAEDFSIYAYDPAGGAEIAFTLVPTNGNDFTLRQLAHQLLRNQPWSRKPTFAEDTTVAGEPAYHLTGPVGDGLRTDAFGVARDDMHIMLDVETDRSPEKQQQMVEAVLATWQWA